MGGSISRERVQAWLEGYERAWRSPGTEALADLFTEDASYRQSPYEEPRTGLRAIAEMWEAEREGPDDAFTMRSDVVAADGDVAIARVEVSYGGPPAREYRDLWVMRFAEDGRCHSFEEWPFFPGQPYAAGDG